jgi:hypothetical protein
MSRSFPPRYREQLDRTVGSAAVPYGYTLSIWGAGGVAIHAFGPPSPLEALLYVTGGAVGYFICGVLAQGTVRVRLHTPAPPAVMAGWGAVHAVSAGLAVLAAAGAIALLDDILAWPAAGLVATVVYLVVSALQAALAAGPP